MTTKTEIQMFTETAAGYWKAIGELANVANAYRTGLQREAHRAQAVLQKTLDRAIAEWNDIGDPEHAHIDLCAAQVRYAPWDTDNCTIYVVNG